jgi:chromosomal replication initiator protein
MIKEPSVLINPYVFAGIKPAHLPSDIQDRMKISVFKYKKEYVNEAIEKFLGVDEKTLASRWRKRHVCDARHMYCGIMRDKLNWYLDDIGETIGGRDHTTVINSIEQHNALLDTNEKYREGYKKVSRYVDIMSAVSYGEEQ